jgi:hypothetical protein
VRAKFSGKFTLVFFVALASLSASTVAGYAGWPPKSLVDMGNQEIRQRERRLTTAMRGLEQSRGRSQIHAMATSDQYEMMRADQEMQAVFEKKYLRDALAMRCELLRREYQPCPPALVESILVPGGDYRLLPFTGQLAGPSPMNDAADYLDELVNKLQ